MCYQNSLLLGILEKECPQFKEMAFMWFFNSRGERESRLGHNEWSTAAQIAQCCSQFKLDVEEETVANETVSCYNCRFRKWTDTSFVCCKKES